MLLNAYLTLDGNCREAFEHYAQVLGARIALLMDYGGAPGCEHLQPPESEKIIHVRLEGDGWVLMGSDSPAHIPYKGIEGCSLSLNVTSVAEADRLYNGLAEGGQAIMPLEKTFFSERFGMLKDRFGVTWMVNLQLPGA